MSDWARAPESRRDVARENLTAAGAGIDPNDPRWVLAARVRAQLQGTALTPERRQRTLRTAAHLGIRPFDANLIIAAVQEQARTGRRADELSGLLAVIPAAPKPASNRGRIWLQLAAACATAIVLALVLIRWLLGA